MPLPQKTRNEVASLASYLKQQFRCDVIIPLVPGEKRPLYRYKPSTIPTPPADGPSEDAGQKPAESVCLPWSWDAFDEWFAAADAPDVGILLKELCVIDFDDEDTAIAFEAEFPVLKDVPMERTTHGRHYFFERSSKADLDGYFDCIKGRHHKIDFKTLCKNGTPGVIAVSPSPGKGWVRAPWDGGVIMPIPDALLTRVAVPTHDKLSARLRFVDDPDAEDADLDIVESPWLGRIPYFEPFLEDIHDGDRDANNTELTIIPVPRITRAVFEDMLRVCEFRIPHRVFKQEEVAAIIEAADFLGVPSKYLSSIQAPYGVLYRLADIDTVSPVWSKEAMNDAFALRSQCWPSTSKYTWGGQADNALVQLTPEYCRNVLYDNVIGGTVQDGRWLLNDVNALHRSAVLTPGDAVFVSDPSATAAANLPRFVQKLLKRFPESLCLAGGAALGCVATKVVNDASSDYDLFVCAGDVATANNILIAALEDSDCSVAYVSGASVTMQVKNAGSSACIVQIVLRLHESRQHVIWNFDLAPCKILIYYQQQTDKFVVEASTSCIESVRHMATWVPIDCWSRSSAVRVFKYYAKGFDIFVPGLRRAAIGSDRGARELLATQGLTAMMGIEAHFRSICGQSLQRLQPHHVRAMAQKLMKSMHGGNTECDYADNVKLSGLLPIQIASIVRAVSGWVRRSWMRVRRAVTSTGEQRLLTLDAVRSNTVMWLRGAAGPFRPSSARWDLLHTDHDLYHAMMLSLTCNMDNAPPNRA